MTPVLYSFRRCPYAMRARLAIASARVEVELREVVLRDKPEAFLKVSPSATVPCLAGSDLTIHPHPAMPDGRTSDVIDESLEIMIWALQQNDPEGWLNIDPTRAAWIERGDGSFKRALDRVKYATRYPEEDASEHLAAAVEFLTTLDAELPEWGAADLVDYALLPFIRQFAMIDKDWFDAQPWPALHTWLSEFLSSDRLANVMKKYPQWKEGDAALIFGANGG